MSRLGDIIAGTSRIWERNCAEAISLIGDRFYSGTYTPTLTNVANIDASTAYVCQYVRLGDVVHVSGRVDIDATAAAATLTQLGVSLPIASDFANSQECAGTGVFPGVQSSCAAVLGDTTNNRAQIQYLSASAANNGMFFSFTYRII